MSNRVVHFEIPCTNPEKTIEFFKKVFDWKIEKFGSDDYWSITTGEASLSGINGGILKKIDPSQGVVNSIQVLDLDKKLEDIKQAGGTIIVPKSPIPTIGYIAYFKDPDGNMHGLFMEDTKASAT